MTTQTTINTDSSINGITIDSTSEMIFHASNTWYTATQLHDIYNTIRKYKKEEEVEPKPIKIFKMFKQVNNE